jgi:phospholipase/carboxylesterase
MTPDSPQVIDIEGWIMRLRIPPGDSPHPLVALLHGWTGDETSMWIFATRFPDGAMLLAPRGLYPAKLGGFGWQKSHSQGWPHWNDFLPAIDAFLRILTPTNFPSADLSRVSLVGFSQGAALAYSLALVHPERVISLAGLSGFMPEGVGHLVEQKPLKGKSLFVSHGTQDDLVPVEKARDSVRLLQQAGARVTYCENDVGHKLNATCFRSMQTFFTKAT